MDLDFRSKEGLFIVSFKGHLVEPILKYLLKEERLSVEIKKFTGEKDKCRVFVNNSEEIVSGANESVEFFIRPGEYVKIINP
jgi:hypothetical protein